MGFEPYWTGKAPTQAKEHAEKEEATSWLRTQNSELKTLIEHQQLKSPTKTYQLPAHRTYPKLQTVIKTQFHFLLHYRL